MDSHSGTSKVFPMLDQLVEQILAKDLEDAFSETRCGRRSQDFKGCAFQYKMDFGKCQSIMSTVGRYLAQFVGFRSEEFAARRDVIEQVLNSDLSSAGETLFALGKKPS